MSDAKRSELLAQNLQRDLKDETAAFVPRQQDLPSFLADGTDRQTGHFQGPVCVSRLPDTDGTGRLAIFTVPSVPSCFSETCSMHVTLG